MKLPKRPETLSLQELRRASKVVEIDDDQKIAVHGLNATCVADLIERFPAMRKYMLGGGLTVDEIIKEGAEPVAAIIAAGCSGEVGDEAQEAAAADIDLEAQAQLIEAIYQCTFTRGFGPFAFRLLGGVVATQSVQAGKAPPSKSPTPSPTSPAPQESTPGASPQDNLSPMPTSTSDDASLMPALS